MIRPIRCLSEYFFGTETIHRYRSQCSLGREFILDEKALKDYICDSTADNLYFLFAGRLISNLFTGYNLYHCFSTGRVEISNLGIFALSEFLRNAVTAHDRLIADTKELELSRLIEENSVGDECEYPLEDQE